MIQTLATLVIPVFVRALITDSSAHNRRNFLSDTVAKASISIFGLSSPTIAAEPVIYSSTPKIGSRTILGYIWNEPIIATELGKSILLAQELNPLSQPFDLLSAENEIFYDPFLFGSWNTTATLVRKIYPYGYDFVPSSSLIEGSPRYRLEQIGDSHTYETHFYSTLPNTLSNQFIVNAGLGVPKSKIIADRRYNAISMSASYKQMTPVLDVIWDPRKDPTRLTYIYAAGLVADDLRPLGEKRGEIFITARRTEEAKVHDDIHSDGKPVFCAAERLRSVSLTTGNVVVSDMEITTEYVLFDPNHVRAFSRLAVFLVPNPNSREGVLWQEVGGKAVAFFDYELDMNRQIEILPTGERVICVETPKMIKQCEAIKAAASDS